MARIDGEGREHREEPIVEHALHYSLPIFGKVGDAQDLDAFAFERRQQVVVEQSHLRCKRAAQTRGDRGEMLGRHTTVVGTSHDLRFDLLFDRRNANHEKLVEIRAVDCNELESLEQWVTRVKRFL